MKMSDKIDYPTIVSAKQGDEDAINRILRYYKPYILHFCKRTIYDEVGIPHEIIDENRKKLPESEYLLRYRKIINR